MCPRTIKMAVNISSTLLQLGQSRSTVEGQLLETSVMQNVPNQKSIIDHTLGNTFDSDYENLTVGSSNKMNFKVETTILFTIHGYSYRTMNSLSS